MSDEFRLAWLRHPDTKRLRKLLSEKQALAHTALLNRARNSSDPLVSASYASWHALGEALDGMKDTPEEE